MSRQAATASRPAARAPVRGSALHGMYCRGCSHACDRCAESCKQLAGDSEVLRNCAETCRRCAESCRQMAGAGD
jgi:hypothetical protein